MGDFLVQYLKYFRKFLANFTSTLNTNISFAVDINIIYFLSIFVIIGYIIFVFIKYWKDIPDRQTLFIRVFVGGFLSILLVGFIGHFLKKVNISNLHILQVEGFISDDNNLSNLDLQNKLDFYGINVDLNDIQKRNLRTLDGDEKTLYFAYYFPNNNLTIKTDLTFKVISVNNGINIIKGSIKVLGYDKTLGQAVVQIQIDNYNISTTTKIYAIQDVLGNYVFKDGTLLRLILKASSQLNNLFIVQMGRNLYFNPFLVYKIAIDDDTKLSLRQIGLSFPFLYFLLDNANKNMFIYDEGDYYTVTFKTNSFLGKLLSKYQRPEILGSKDKAKAKRYLIMSYLSNNGNSIAVLLLGFVYHIIVFIIKYLAYILYVFIPALVLFFIKNLVKPEQI